MKMIEVASSAKKYNHTVFIFRAVSNFDKLLMHIIQVGLANYKYVGSSRDNFIHGLLYSGGVRGVQVVQLHHSILRKLHNSKAIAPLDLRTLKC